MVTFQMLVKKFSLQRGHLCKRMNFFAEPNHSKVWRLLECNSQVVPPYVFSHQTLQKKQHVNSKIYVLAGCFEKHKKDPQNISNGISHKSSGPKVIIQLQQLPPGVSTLPGGISSQKNGPKNPSWDVAKHGAAALWRRFRTATVGSKSRGDEISAEVVFFAKGRVRDRQRLTKKGGV